MTRLARRISIVGTSGSGKTHLATRVAAHTGIEFVFVHTRDESDAWLASLS